MTSIRAKVVWEDSLARDARRFGPHILVVACIEDDTGLEQRSVEALVRGFPVKGSGQVIEFIKSRLALEAQGAPPVFIVLDSDQAWRLVSAKKSDSRAAVAARIRSLSPMPELIRVSLLERNAESLVLAAGIALRRPGYSARGFVVPKNRSHRDGVLMEAARPENRAIRKRVRARMPSFDRLILDLSALVRAAAVTEPGTRTPDRRGSAGAPPPG